jgi:hypothetical protein
MCSTLSVDLLSNFVTPRVFSPLCGFSAAEPEPISKSSRVAIWAEFDTGSTDLALMMGGGLDVRVNDKFKVRVFQVDYAPIFLGDRAVTVLGAAGALRTLELEGQRQDHVRFSFGLIF